jgi:hypothetical protein
LAGALATWLISANPGAVTLGIVISKRWIRMIFNYMYILISFFGVYIFFCYLVRVRTVNRIFSYLTLTNYYRRYHEPDITRNDYMKKYFFVGRA